MSKVHFWRQSKNKLWIYYFSDSIKLLSVRFNHVFIITACLSRPSSLYLYIKSILNRLFYLGSSKIPETLSRTEQGLNNLRPKSGTKLNEQKVWKEEKRFFPCRVEEEKRGIPSKRKHWSYHAITMCHIDFVWIYSVFRRFGPAKFAYGGSILGSSQFLLLPRMPQNLILIIRKKSKVIQNYYLDALI